MFIDPRQYLDVFLRYMIVGIADATHHNLKRINGERYTFLNLFILHDCFKFDGFVCPRQFN